MLKPYLQQKIVERVLRNASGERFRVVFLLSLVDGSVQARILSATPLFKRHAYACLPCIEDTRATDFPYTAAFAHVYSWFDELFFFMSQPTRAPAAGSSY